jgi:hypothetical protein
MKQPRNPAVAYSKKTFDKYGPWFYAKRREHKQLGF